jgi:putative transcriptional regulator
MKVLNKPTKGALLIAKPFLGDPNFERGVVLLCEHNEEGSFGFVFNQRSGIFLADAIETTIYQDIPLYVGGPVEVDTLHLVHTRPDLIPGGKEVLPGVFWGGDFEQVKMLLNSDAISNHEIRFFIGYSGWDVGQIDFEIKSDSWIICDGNAQFLFSTPDGDFWRELLKSLGGNYRSIANYPIDPRLN